MTPNSSPTGLDLPDDLLVSAAQEVRNRMLTCCVTSEFGHVGGCSGAVEILTALYLGGVLRYDPTQPRCPTRDRLLLRGHLGPTRYAIFSLLGWVRPDELAGHATLGSLLEGHESVELPGVDIGPSGSLGMVLSQGAGAATAAACRGGWRTFVLVGDGEEQEGNIAEAARDAVAAHVERLIAVIDVNGHQLSGPTTSADRSDVSAIWRAYGWRVVELADGNDVLRARDVLGRAAELAQHRPVAVVAHTTKGHGLPGARRHFSGYHELSHCPPDLIELARLRGDDEVEEQIRVRIDSADVATTPPAVHANGRAREPLRTPPVDPGWASLAPDDFQLAYLTALASVWDRQAGRLYFLHADTFPGPLLQRTGLADAADCRNVGIREQHLIALAHGLSVSDPSAVVIVHTGDAFLPRAIDQLNAAAIGGGRCLLLADDAGITNARNGVSHQSALTSRMVSTLPEVTAIEPADGVDFGLAVNDHLGRGAGITYLRLHDALIRHPIGLATTDRSTRWYQIPAPTEDLPDVALLACGFLVGEAIGAIEILAADGIRASVTNIVQPALAGDAARPLIDQGVPIVTVYDGHPDTLADPVRRALATRPTLGAGMAAVGFLRGRSGRLDELLHWAGVDARSIATVASALLGDSVGQEVAR